ncbi:hypothetical protein AB0K21_14785 [Streptosporangium sp. NPDC049248]|uniref:hypothetical protein n=1 Tax=Streptosporangium sp. NPDC049248 TaxID=3155651 RepID=UPI00344809AE
MQYPINGDERAFWDGPSVDLATLLGESTDPWAADLCGLELVAADRRRIESEIRRLPGLGERGLPAGLHDDSGRAGRHRHRRGVRPSGRMLRPSGQEAKLPVHLRALTLYDLDSAECVLVQELVRRLGCRSS